MQFRWVLLSAGLILASEGWSASAHDPADPKATVAPLTYKSVFEGYRGQTDAKVGVWKDANDNVGRIGGWRVYLKEAHAPEPPASTPSKPALQAKPAAPRGHHQH